MYFRSNTRFLAPDNLGGGGAGGGDAAGAAGAGGSQVGGAGAGGTGGSDAGGSAGSDKGGSGQSSGKNAPDYSKIIAEKDAKIKELTTGLDTAGQKIGSYRKLEERMKLNPVEFASQILKDAGIEKFSLGDAATGTNDTDLYDAEGKVDPKKLQKLLDERDRQNELKRMQKNATADTVIYEDQMRKKYPDWDTSKDERDAIRLAQIAGDIRPSELYHLANVARKLPQILEGHKALVIKEYQKELDEKRGASGAGGGTGRGETKLPEGSVDIRDNPDEAGRVLGRMKRVV